MDIAIVVPRLPVTDIAILSATSAHVRALGQSLRAEDEREITCLGLVAHKVLFRSWRRAVMRRTALVDGEVDAMWGVGGVLCGPVGFPWLLTGKAAERASPLTFARIYQREVRDMLRLFPVLENWVDASHEKAIRMLEIAGFQVGEPREVRPGVWFRPYRMVA